MHTSSPGHRAALVAISAALCLALSGSSGAFAAPGGHTMADYPAIAPATKLGDTPADFAQPSPSPKLGDTPVDDPGASRAPKYDPLPTIVVTRPVRTIVRNVDDTLPIALSGAALLFALSGLALVVTRGRIAPRH